MIVCGTVSFCPFTHITAAQLRRMGFLVAESVPDEAFVRRIAVGLDDRELLDDGSASLGLEILEPFMVRRNRLRKRHARRIS